MCREDHRLEGSLGKKTMAKENVKMSMKKDYANFLCYLLWEGKKYFEGPRKREKSVVSINHGETFKSDR